MVNASIRINGILRSYEVSKIKAHFKIMLPAGDYSMEIACHDYEPKLLNIKITQNHLLALNVSLSKVSENSTHSTVFNTDAYKISNLNDNANITSGIKG